MQIISSPSSVIKGFRAGFQPPVRRGDNTARQSQRYRPAPRRVPGCEASLLPGVCSPALITGEGTWAPGGRPGSLLSTLFTVPQNTDLGCIYISKNKRAGVTLWS